MANNSLQALAALALVGSTSALTLLSSPAPAQAGWWKRLTGLETPKFIRELDLSDGNSAISKSAAGKAIHTIGRGIDPTNPERNGGWWPKLDVTDPNQPISQFCNPLLQYGTAAAAAAYGAPPKVGMAGGSTAASILCANGSNYGPQQQQTSQFNQPQSSYPMGLPAQGQGYPPIMTSFPVQPSGVSNYAVTPYQPRY